MKTTEIEGLASIGAALDGIGETLDCANLRERGGSLDALMPRQVVATLGGRPVACDLRDGKTLIITQEDDGTLLLACRISESNETDYPDMPIGSLAEPVRQGARVGEFLVLRGASGTLYYLHDDDGGEYRWLGTLPSAPQWSAEAVSATTLQGVVPDVKFSTVVADPRGGLGEENEKAVGRAVASAFSERLGEARNSGLRVMPVMVRVAWRLKGGGLLHISDALRIGGDGALPGRERIMMGLATNDKGATGTSGGTFTINAWRLKVTLLTSLPAAWRDVIEGAEVWVSREPDALRAGESPGVAVVQGTPIRVACSLPAVSDAAVESQLPTLPMRASRLMDSAGEHLVGNSESSIDESITGLEVPDGMSDADDARADYILGYADILYTGRGTALHSSKRGNPLLRVSTTPNVGGRVESLWPQVCGGGAYTRQYIYVATRSGLAALMHDKDGIHTNCRMVAPVRVIDAVPTLTGLYAAGGEVIKVTDARAVRICRNVEGTRRVGYSEREGLLMLMNGANSVVLAEDGGYRATRWNFGMQMLGGCLWRRLGWYEMRTGVVEIYDVDRGRTETPSGVYYRGRLPAPPGGRRRPMVLYVAVSGEALMAQIRIRAGVGRVMKEVVRVHAAGNVPTGLRVPVNLPRGVTDWEVTINGSFEHFDGFRWLPNK